MLTALTLILIGLLSRPKVAANQVEVLAVPTVPELTPEQKDLKHRQEVWISALEWHESRGRNSALNPKDRDGTPSYSNFQWKPSTFIGYAKKI